MRKLKGGLIAVGMTAAVGSIAPLLMMTLSQDATASPQTDTTPVIIDSHRHEVFVPAPSNASTSGGWTHEQSAESAWASFATENQFETAELPDAITPLLGRLTAPVGPVGKGGAMAYDARDKVVWGYKWTWCQPGTNDDPDMSNCIHWLFLDGDTAAAIDETWQH